MVVTKIRIITILFFLIILDFSSDSVMRIFPIDTVLITKFSQFVISTVMALFLFSFGLKIPRKFVFVAPFFMVIGVIIFGLIHGMLSNNVGHAVNEAIPFLFFTSFLSFAGMKQPVSVLKLEVFLKIFVYVMVFKLIVYSVASYFFYGAFSWKILMKQSPLLLIPLSIYFSKITAKKVSIATNYLIFLVLFCIAFAMARMLLLGLIFLIGVHFFNKRVMRAWPIIILVGFMFVPYLFLIGKTPSLLFSLLYGGDIYQQGMTYRIVQFDVILDRLRESPFFGVGFGYFTPGYLTYGELRKPYLLELDILNFISKIGLIGTFIYALSYIGLFKLIIRLSDDEVRRTGVAFFWALLALSIYSLGQTMHQSYIYWVYFAFVYGFVVSHLRAQSQAFTHNITTSLSY